MRLRGIPELLDERMPLERLLDDAPLNAFAAPVDQPYLAEPGCVGGGDVLLDHGRNVGGKKRMEVEGSLDRDTVGGIVKSQIPNPKA